MPGPAPNPKAVRRGTKLKPLGPGPEEPARQLPEGTWTLSIHEWWTEIWTSPVARLWNPRSAYLPLVRLAQLNQAFLGLGDARMAAEARQIEDRYGLNPAALAKLGYYVPDELPEASQDTTVASDDASRSAAAERDGSVPTEDDASRADPGVDPRRLTLVVGDAKAG